MLNKTYLITISSIVGLVLDFFLQLSTRYFNLGGKNGFGLKSYFLYHGTFESLCIASGMMVITFIIYLYFLPFNVNYLNLAIYGILIDFIFRQTMIFKDLISYYKQFNYFWTALFSAITMMIPYMIYNL